MTFQKENLSTYAKKIKKSETRIKWEENAKEINLKIRAFNPFPGAWTKIRGDDKRIKILKSEVVKKKIVTQKNLVIGGVGYLFDRISNTLTHEILIGLMLAVFLYANSRLFLAESKTLL